jgi:hypothetical protein
MKYIPIPSDEFLTNGGIVLVKVTESAISAIKKEVQDLLNEGQKPLIRLTMGIG